MKNYLDEIVSRFPVRRSAEQKAAFRAWATEELCAMGYAVKTEQNAGKHENLVVGDPESVPVLFTAHYDTPSTIGLPNIMMPRTPVLAFLYQMLVVLLLLAVSAVVMLAVGAVTGDPQAARLAWIAAYFVVLLMMNYGGIPNKHNVNDNTSGVAALMEIMAQLPAEHRGKAAVILFDNEEKGLAGSKAYTREHQQVGYTRFTVNMDCVGVGENILVISKKQARNHLEFAPMQRHMAAVTERRVHFFDAAGSVSNTDWKSFKSSVTLCACKKAPVIGFYTAGIHTGRDTEADPVNIRVIADAMAGYISELTV